MCTRKFIITLVGAISFSTLLSAGSSQLYRSWTLESGKSILAKLNKVKDGRAELITTKKKRLNVPYDKLVYYDQLAINAFLREGKKTELPLRNENGFDDSFRKMIPTISQTVFGRKKGSCIPNAFMHFLLWWNDLGIFSIPKKGDRIKQSEWLHKELEQFFETRSSGTTHSDAVTGIKEFFKEYESENYKMVISDTTKGSLEELQSEVQGVSATILSLKTLKKGKVDEGHGVCLVSLTDDNWITFHTWGDVFTGRLVKAMLKGEAQPYYYVDLVLNPGSKFYDWIIKGGGFAIPEKSLSYFVIKPELKEKAEHRDKR